MTSILSTNGQPGSHMDTLNSCLMSAIILQVKALRRTKGPPTYFLILSILDRENVFYFMISNSDLRGKATWERKTTVNKFSLGFK